MTAVVCPNCGTTGDGQDSMCPVCSAPLYDGAEGYDPQPGAPASSSTRRPGASPAERASYLRGLPGADGEPPGRMSLLPPARDGTMPLISALGRADEAVESAERAMADADSQLEYVREVVCAGALDEADLDGGQRAQLRDAQDASYRAGQRYKRARERQNMLLADYDQIPSRRAATGGPGTPTGPDPPETPGMTPGSGRQSLGRVPASIRPRPPGHTRGATGGRW